MKLSRNSVLRDNSQDCTMNGLSSNNNKLDLHFGDIKIEDVKDTDLVLVERVIYGEESNYTITGQEYKAKCGIGKLKSTPMFGGNFIYSSHSAFPSNSPIKIFDRYES